MAKKPLPDIRNLDLHPARSWESHAGRAVGLIVTVLGYGICVAAALAVWGHRNVTALAYNVSAGLAIVICLTPIAIAGVVFLRTREPVTLPIVAIIVVPTLWIFVALFLSATGGTDTPKQARLDRCVRYNFSFALEHSMNVKRSVLRADCEQLEAEHRLPRSGRARTWDRIH